MPLSELLPTVSELSHKDKLRLIHFLLLAVAREEGCSLETAENRDLENALLNQLASTEAVVWSPHADRAAVQALSDLLVSAQGSTNGKALFGNLDREDTLMITNPFQPNV